MFKHILYKTLVCLALKKKKKMIGIMKKMLSWVAKQKSRRKKLKVDTVKNNG